MDEKKMINEMFGEPCCCRNLKWNERKKRHVCKVCKSEYIEHPIKSKECVQYGTALEKVKDGRS